MSEEGARDRAARVLAGEFDGNVIGAGHIKYALARDVGHLIAELDRVRTQLREATNLDSRDAEIMALRRQLDKIERVHELTLTACRQLAEDVGEPMHQPVRTIIKRRLLAIVDAAQPPRAAKP